ncbi:sigma-70 family RNA polymerase sigma factor [Bacteroidales bacterium OttesenSCG-928-B11]|nr:sigma-70 family RNA polymerase sigma factor [Bacteroidales bacterium OttesenSCG-928-E04]MDL2309081.1 sigma-70 family RNA polymerase sigma factor [Bacteroidales bacterium OttesenSCG-928-C03]MDL2312189.1 sigma-70 family RNA polymerase sigma factor [Bacteroidales bacterium OttesenSCG-928-B11]MDL2326242.1 sigma-70 family RNA polymerase sigma factor [Bacteroidales bacterium OttesenSCG-928-A14]
MTQKTHHLTEKAQRDYVLVQDALQNGNQKAYAELMRYYRDPLYYMLLKMVHNPYDAEDLTIEALGKAFKNLDRYTDDFAFSTWLFRIAVNNCIDYIRKRNCSPNCIDDELSSCDYNLAEYSASSRQPTPEDTIIEKQMIKMMHLAVKQLRPKYREAVELRYFKELSYEEVAEQMGISISNVKVLLFRAKEMLAAITVNIKNAI